MTRFTGVLNGKMTEYKSESAESDREEATKDGC